jgi:hypothetical protein
MCTDNRAAVYSSGGFGGAVYVNGGIPSVSNCTFTNNTASVSRMLCLHVDIDGVVLTRL